MNSILIVNLFAIALLHLVSSAAVAQGHQKPPHPPVLPPKPEEFFGLDGHRFEHNDTEHDRVTILPRERGTERPHDSSEEGVTRDPFGKRDKHLFTEAAGFRGDAGRGGRRGKRHSNGRPRGSKEDLRDKVTLRPRDRGTERPHDSSEEGVTRDPFGKRDKHLFTEAAGFRGDAGRAHHGNH